jgi:hypothetical protein
MSDVGCGAGAGAAAPQHPLFTFGAGLRRKRQKAEQADRGLVPAWTWGSALSLSAPRRPPATKFSRPAAQHPFWAGLRRRRQKVEQADRGVVLTPSSGLGLGALLSLPLGSSSATKLSRPCGAAPAYGLACGAEGRKQSKRIGDYPLLQGGGNLVLSLSPVSLSPGLALLSLPLSSSSATKFSRPAAQKAGRKQSKQIGDYPLLQGGVI